MMFSGVKLDLHGILPGRKGIGGLTKATYGGIHISSRSDDHTQRGGHVIFADTGSGISQ